jgi:hypothetical protein
MAFSPDGRFLASSDVAVVHLWEVATGKEICSFPGHRGDIKSLAFSGNGRRLASASTDSTVLIWDFALALGVAGPLVKSPNEREIAAWWADLAEVDARRAYAAVWRLAEMPGVSVPFLRRHLRPVTDAKLKEIRQHLKDLDSDAFAVREKAFQQLERFGLDAVSDLRSLLKQELSLEVRRRIERLLENLNTGSLTGEPLRTHRALAALEYAGTPEARQLVRDLEDGAPGSWVTQAAKAVGERLASRKVP